MKSFQKKILPWLLGIAAASILFAVLFFIAGFHYSGSDDSPILRSFMGYEGGRPASFHLCLHTFLAWGLHGLALLSPGTAWFSILQLFLLWFSSAVIVKSAAKTAAQHGLSPWLGGLWGALLIGMFALFPSCRVSFTTTSAWVGAAAAAQLLSVDYREGKTCEILRGMGLSIGLLFVCYSFRQIGVLPPLAFWLLGLALIWLLHYAPLKKAQPRKSPKPLLLGMLICAMVFGLSAGVRAVELKALNLGDYLKWHQARIQLFDYTGLDTDIRPETLEKLGWSEEDLTLVANWFFMDESITAEAFELLYAEKAQALDLSLSGRLAAVRKTIPGFFAANPPFVPACGLLLLLSLLGILLSLFRRGEGGLWLALASLAAPLLCGAMLLYLAWQGRLPMRAAATAIFPLGAFLFTLLPMLYQPNKGKAQALVCTCLLVAAAALSGLTVSQTLPLLHIERNPDLQLLMNNAGPDLDEYAAMNPDMLIICDLSLASNDDMFPDTSQGIPPNIMFWGGYPAHSPSWLYQLAQYGIDGSAMTAWDFLRENVLVASTDGSPWESLTAHIQQHTDVDVEWATYDEYGYVGLFQYYEY